MRGLLQVWISPRPFTDLLLAHINHQASYFPTGKEMLLLK